jgi:two-component system, cell cycle sensor histidine kinase and response regulator CckA
MTHQSVILAVDTHRASLNCLSDILTARGYQVALADSVPQAREMASASPPDLMLAEVRLPGMDGVELLRWVTAQPWGGAVPVILISENIDPAQRAAGFTLGAADFIVEPYMSEELLARIRSQLDLSAGTHVIRLETDDFASRQRDDQGNVPEFHIRAGTLPDVVARFDRQKRYIFVSREVGSAPGFPAAKYAGKSIREVGTMPSELIEGWEQALDQVFRTGQAGQIDFEIHSPEGRVSYEARLVPEFGAGGRVDSVLGINRNVSERKEAESALRDSARRLAEAQQLSHIGSWQWIPSQNKVVWSDEMYRIFGISPEDFDGTTESAIRAFHPDDRALIDAATRKALSDRQVQGVECRVLRPDGTIRYVISAGHMEISADGSISEMSGTYQDITERKLLEQTLGEREQRLRMILQTALDGFWLVNLQGQFLDVNDAYCAISGYTHDELLRMRIPDIEAIESESATSDRIGRIVREGRDRFETRHRRKDGRIIDVEIGANYLDLDGGRIVCVCRDITERKHLENEREITVQLLGVLNSASDQRGLLSSVLDLLHRWSGCDAVAIRLNQGDDFPYFETSGFPATFVEKENLLCARDARGGVVRDGSGNPILECMCGNVLCSRFDPTKPFFTQRGSFWSNCTTRLLATTTDSDRQTRTRNRCNGEGYESVALIPLRTGGVTYGLLQLNDHRQGRFTLSLIELLERLGENLAIALAQFQAQQALEDSEARLQVALQASNQGIFEVDLVSGKTNVSGAFASLLGYSPGEFPADWLGQVHPDDREIVGRMYRETILGDQDEAGTEYRLRAKAGEYRWMLSRGKVVTRDDSGRPTRILGTHMDITERKRAEEALRLAQKTESLGVLAGGVAHDFNNLLVAILGQTSLALAKLSPESAANAPIQKAVAAAQRAADLTRQLLAYSGRGRFTVQPLRLNSLVEENLRLLEVALPKNVRLAADLAEHLPMIQADAGQLQQVLMNLIINAAEAIGVRPGAVAIRTGVTEISASDCHLWRHTGELPAAGRYVILQVSDDGCGMDALTLNRIFDPFFTTKFTGRGLGLAAVLGIVKGHRGGLRVESIPGAGTTFNLAFPATAHEEFEFVQTAPARSAEIPSLSATGLVLLIDDEEPVRDAVTDILAMGGIRVLTAGDGREGVALFRAHEDDIRLVLLDLSMPGMSGEEAFKQIRSVNPIVPIILSSGYDESEVSARFADHMPTGFIQKPYSMATLTEAVRHHLAASRSER